MLREKLETAQGIPRVVFAMDRTEELLDSRRVEQVVVVFG